jgi:hypothetical protein
MRSAAVAELAIPTAGPTSVRCDVGKDLRENTDDCARVRACVCVVLTP